MKGINTMTVDQAVTTILALRDMTATSGTITTRVQSRVLRSLSDDDLVRVALKLKQYEITKNILSGKPAEDADVDAK
jgi:hypothetical protein